MRVGVVDIGTNSMRLLIADHVGGSLVEVERDAVVTRLGRGVDATGLLAAEPMARTIEALQRYGDKMQQAGVDGRAAVATSASRDAANADEFLDRAEAALGVRPRVIAGSAEARLAYRGATLNRPVERVLVIDVGGGSTEFIAGLAEPEYVASVDIGSVRLTDRMPPERPAPTGVVVEARAAVAAMFARQLDLPAVSSVIGVAGTYTSLAAMHLSLPRYDRAAVDDAVLTIDDLANLVGELATLSAEEVAVIPSLDPARAPVILGGAIVALEALTAAGHDRLVVSETDILDGLALSLAAG